VDDAVPRGRDHHRADGDLVDEGLEEVEVLMARKKGHSKRLVDCTVECAKSGRHDFNVWPRAGESDNEACLRRSKDFQAAVDDCGVLRARGIQGAGGKLASPSSDDVTAAAARALRACTTIANPDCKDACRTGIAALERQLHRTESKKIHLDGVKPGRIIRES
jgi:hypothetical protein